MLCYLRDMRNLLLCFSLGCMFGCSDDHACTSMACGGEFVVALVDDAGLPLAAHGEFRNTRGTTTFKTEKFGWVDFALSPNDAAEIHFELADGSFTPWQSIEFEFERHTDPDFNGPGCSCSWYDASSKVVVPAAARGTLEDAGAGDAGR
jgi:hypothetical protein